MKDNEKFQKTFDKLHASPEVLEEVLKMTNEEKIVSIKKANRRFSRVAAAIVATLLVIGTGTAAYAMDIVGIQKTIKIWIYGEQTDANFEYGNGKYTLMYTDANGNECVEKGGTTFVEDGTSSITQEDIFLNLINRPEVVYEEDGTVKVYYLDQVFDITDKFINRVCRLELQDGKIMTIEYKSSGYTLEPGEASQTWTFHAN